MRALPALLALLILVAVVELVRRRRLREEFSWVWMLGGFGALLLAVHQGTRAALARLSGLGEGEAAIVAALLFLALVALDLSTQVSRLLNQQKNLAQDLGRLDKRVSDLEEPPP